MTSEILRLKAEHESASAGLREEILKRQRELVILAEVATRIHGEDEIKAILDAALDSILRGLGLTTAWIFLGDQSDRVLQLAAHRGVEPSYLEWIERRGLGDCLCPEVFSSGHRMQARNTTDCPRMPTIVQGLDAPVAHACIPLLLEGTSRGVLNVAALPGRVFGEEELRFLETVGRQVCIAMERAQHLKAERAFDQEARALAALNKRIGESLDIDAVVGAVTRTALEALGADRATVYLGSKPRSLEVADAAGRPHPGLSRGQTVDLDALGAKAERRALEEQRSALMERPDGGPRSALDLGLEAGSSALLLPLVAHKVCLGLLVIDRKAMWIGIERQIGEALAAQASVALENARLYENARRAYLELNEAQTRIIQSEKMAVAGTFASGLAHEVRNPLNSIALQLSILERRVAPLGPPLAAELADLVGVIRQEVNRLDNLVGDFLLFSRANRSHYRSANLDALVDDVVRLLGPAARTAGVHLVRRRSGEPIPDLPIDGERMKQVVINLVQNAIEAMPSGGEVLIESGLRDGKVRLTVRDHGPGLPTELDVFQFFVTTKAKGTGLGLPIAQQIVLEHGGEISAENAAGGGALFVVSLPAAAVSKPRSEHV